jgi:hypothetical protein
MKKVETKNKISMVDFNQCETNLRFYGGEGGAKLGISFRGDNWLLKYPRTTKGLINPKVSYTTSPLSEYIGSQIYNVLGIPVHETLLGYRDGKVVVACKDFLRDGETLADFRSIKNTYSEFTFDSGTTGSGTLFSEVLTVLNTNPVLNEVPGLKERFWNMFVIDALIGNYDRNNTNWGLIIKNNEILGLAPVFDNGAAFYDKRDDETFKNRLGDEKAYHADAISNSMSAYTDSNEKRINPFLYIASHENKDCDAAVLRLAGKLKERNISKTIDEVPNSEKGYGVISEAQAAFYKKVMEVRANEIEKEARAIMEQNIAKPKSR